eukprot:1355043-Amphidinium_carterae.10
MQSTTSAALNCVLSSSDVTDVHKLLGKPLVNELQSLPLWIRVGLAQKRRQASTWIPPGQMYNDLLQSSVRVRSWWVANLQNAPVGQIACANQMKIESSHSKTTWMAIRLPIASWYFPACKTAIRSISSASLAYSLRASFT